MRISAVPYVLAQPRKASCGKRKIHAVVGAEAERPARSKGPPRRQGTQICEVLLRHLLPCAAQRRNGRIDLSEVRKKADRENLKMSPFEKIDIEAELTGYSSAGCITYVELPSSVKQNIDALEEIVNYAMDKDIPYFAVNVPNDMCTECGYTDEIGDECPICGCRKIRRLRRVTGYLTGDYIEAFNEGKRQEVDYRVKHFNNALKAKTEKNESH